MWKEKGKKGTVEEEWRVGVARLYSPIVVIEIEDLGDQIFGYNGGRG